MFFIGTNMKSKLLTECLDVNLALFYSDTCSEFINIRSMPCLQKNEGGVQKGNTGYMHVALFLISSLNRGIIFAVTLFL